MPTYAKVVAAATTLLVVAVVGSGLLTALGTIGSAGTPLSPTLIARGDFVIRDWGRVEFEASRGLFGVSGRMEAGRSRPGTTVDFRCARTFDNGLTVIGGYRSPDGTPAALALRGREAMIWVGSNGSWPPTRTNDCLDYLDAWLTWSRAGFPDDDWPRYDIDGNVEFGPAQ